MATIIRKDVNPVRFVENSELLTLAQAESLVGKTIFWSYVGDSANKMVVTETTIGEIVTEYEYASRIACDGYASRATYWDAKLPKHAKAAKETLIIIDADGEPTYMRCDPGNKSFDEPTFVCSDSDRVVLFKAV